MQRDGLELFFEYGGNIHNGIGLRGKIIDVYKRQVRDVKKRGRTLESVVQQYLTTVKPMHEQFVAVSYTHLDVYKRQGRGGRSRGWA